MEEFKEFSFFRGKVKFKQPKKHRLSVIELLFVANLKGIKRRSKVLDLGAGFGTLSILIALKFGCEVYALERDPLMLDLLRYNLKVNNLEDKIKVIEGDLRRYKELIKRGSFDCVVTNPPFYSQENANNPYHFETDTKLEDFIDCSHYSLKDNGYLNILVPTNRLNEAMKNVYSKRFSPIYVRFFYTKETKNAKYARLVCKKNSNSQVIVEKPLIINNLDGSYTSEVQMIVNFMI